MIQHYFYGAVLALLFLAAVVPSPAPAQEPGYELEPGDMLVVTVWRDEDLSREVLVAPDGEISFPLAGRLSAAGRTVESLTEDLTARLAEYIEEPVVTVALKEVRGSRIYVLGKVNRPGMYLLDRSMDVLQALSLAGGMTAYADTDGVRIIRRQGDSQVAFRFEYNLVARGKELDQNLILQSGDVVVVN